MAYRYRTEEERSRASAHRGQRQRETNLLLARESREKLNEIQNIPKPRYPKRITKAKKSFKYFCQEYLPKWFFRPMIPAHDEVIKEFERVVLKGGKKGVAAPRGGFKTTYARAAFLWAALCHPERHKLILYMGATEDAADRSHSIIFNQFLFNQRIKEDFPKVCVPIKAYDGRPQRKPTWKKQPVNASWIGGKITLPTVEKSPHSGITMMFMSISAANIRGLDQTIADVAERPSLVIVDDPQSDKGADSPKTIGTLLAILKKAITNLGGFDRKSGLRQKIAIIMICTCIRQNDMACQIVDRDANPDYAGTVYRRMTSMPKNMNLWDQYKDIRTQSLIKYGDIRAATKFYKDNRKLMDDGAVSIDDNDYEVDQLSGVQYGMDKWAEDAVSFWTEQQNYPERAFWVSESQVTPIVIKDKQVLVPRLQVPESTQAMTCFIDVGDHYFNYEVVAFGPNMSFAHTVDYGVFPDQGVDTISKTSYRVDIQEEYKDRSDSREMKVELALMDLLERITCQPYRQKAGNTEIDIDAPTELHHYREHTPYLKLAMIGIDCRYCESSVWRAIAGFTSKNPNWQNRIMPTYGDSARSRLMRFYDLKPGEMQREKKIRIGGRSTSDWIENPAQASLLHNQLKVIRHSLKYDVNIFKTRRRNAWLLDASISGSHTIFNHTGIDMYAKHQCSEEPFPTTLGGLAYDKWKPIKGRGDNEFLDTNTGCWALADYIGLTSCVSLAEELQQ